MNSYKIISLDDVFNSTARFDNTRLTTSISMNVLEDAFNTKSQGFERVGLGQWEGFVIDIEGKGKLFFVSLASDATISGEWGTDVWIETNTNLSVEDAIAFIEDKIDTNQTLYANPRTGQKLTPPKL